MAQPRRQKPVANTKKKVVGAKQALKKKQLSSNRSRNDDIREKLDRETASLLTIHSISEPRLETNLPSNMDIDLSQSVTDVAAILRNL
ncbi:hypothetical protein BJ912DRAFT_1055764 [Pholiota molesta]|nr:hypothetical protein BJ912DRAFT_1055764 [Pholiota molesta]